MDNEKSYGHARLLLRAAEILGSEPELRLFLRVSQEQLQRWMQGRSMLPTALFLKLADLLAEHDQQSVSQISGQRDELQSLKESSPGLLEKAHAARARAREATRRAILLRAKRQPERGPVAALVLQHRLFDPAFVPADRAELLETALDATLAAAGTDLGNVQIVDDEGALRIAAHHGFADPFLDFFAVVAQPESSCGVAMSIGRQVFISNVRHHPLFMGTRAGEALEGAGAAAVISSPLVHDSGLVMGMISTHYREPRSPQDAALASLDLIARRAASWLDAAPRSGLA